MLERSGWPKGPWDDEPDFEEWIDKDTGLKCHIRRGPMGSLCGYVSVPKGHPAFGVSYNAVAYTGDPALEWWRRHVTQRVEYKIDDIKIHGGLTYSREVDDGWCFGFDCAHAWDVVPGMVRYSEPSDVDVYRDFAYVKRQVEDLAWQLSRITE